MDSPKSVIASLLLTIERLGKALESLEHRVTLIEKFQFESTATWRKKERTCSELFLKMVEKINAVEEKLVIPKEDVQIQTDQSMKKDEFNQKDNKKTKTVGSLAGTTVGEQSTQTEGCGDRNGDEDKPAEGPASKEFEAMDQVCKPQVAVSCEDVSESSAGNKRDKKQLGTEIKCVKENRINSSKTTSFPKIRAGSSSFRRVPRLFPIYFDQEGKISLADLFGKAVTRRLNFLRMVLYWMFRDVGMPELERDITKYVNRISWSDLNVAGMVALASRIHDIESVETQSLFNMKFQMMIIEIALTSDPNTALLIANVTAAQKELTSILFHPSIIAEHQQKGEFTFHSMLFIVLAAAVQWVNNPEDAKRRTKGMPKKCFHKLSKFFETVAENQFSRVAWFICCLRNCGIATRQLLLTMRAMITVTEPIRNSEHGRSKLHFLRKYLKVLEKSTVEGNDYGDWKMDVENPLYCEENMADPKAAKLDRLINRHLKAEK